jgi:hypothetical protein
MTPEFMDQSEAIRVLIDKGALFVACHSGGKDSHAFLSIDPESCLTAVGKSAFLANSETE